MKTRKLLLALGIVGGLEIALENMGSKKEACEIYQGYHEVDTEGAIFFVFDHLPVDSRSAPPRFSLRGNPKLKYSLEIGKNYCFVYLDPISPIGSKRLDGKPVLNPLLKRQTDTTDPFLVEDYNFSASDSLR